MISAGDFRNGVSFERDGDIFQVIEFQHVKPGKGAAFVRTKYRNLKNGTIREDSFNPSEKFKRVTLTRRDMQYLYSDGDLYYFMDNETYEQLPISAAILGDSLNLLKEGTTCHVVSYEGEIINVELPIFVELLITQCEPAVKGDTATNATKTAIVETGAEIKVPLFVNQGDVIKVDTRSGAYEERVRN
ncbi:MAG TPA: elongation factor P [Clostridiaceae bacterium]|nr:elongation factor P [Clostridiaceae bacterium]